MPEFGRYMSGNDQPRGLVHGLYPDDPKLQEDCDLYATNERLLADNRALLELCPDYGMCPWTKAALAPKPKEGEDV